MPSGSKTKSDSLVGGHLTGNEQGKRLSQSEISLL